MTADKPVKRGGGRSLYVVASVVAAVAGGAWMITTRGPRLNQDLSTPHAWPIFIPQQVAASVFKSVGRWLTPPGQQVRSGRPRKTQPLLPAPSRIEEHLVAF
jgi:hypothetical protein